VGIFRAAMMISLRRMLPWAVAGAVIISSGALVLVATLNNSCDEMLTGMTIHHPPGPPRPAWTALNGKLTAEASCTPTAKSGKIVLVTGTGGFIGYHTALALRARGDGVLGLDNFNSYYPASLKRYRASALEAKHILTLDADLNDISVLRKAMQICNFTHVLHLAAQAGVRYATKDPHSYVSSNVAGFVALLEACKEQQPVPRVVYASSSSVYGLNTKVPFSEADVVDRPASLYAATKKSDEMIAHTYNHVYHIAVTGLRFFTVYGPHGRPDMAAFAFANKISKGEQVRIFQGPGGTELERDFTYIDDIVGGCLGAVDHIGESKKPAPYKVYNLGNRHPVNVSHFVDLLEEFMGKPAKRKYVPLPATGDVLRTHANISLAMAELGYWPKTSLREGLYKFVSWYNEYYRRGLDKDMAEYQPM